MLIHITRNREGELCCVDCTLPFLFHETGSMILIFTPSYKYKLQEGVRFNETGGIRIISNWTRGTI